MILHIKGCEHEELSNVKRMKNIEKHLVHIAESLYGIANVRSPHLLRFSAGQDPGRAKVGGGAPTVALHCRGVRYCVCTTGSLK